jgi:hypothetical protein
VPTWALPLAPSPPLPSPPAARAAATLIRLLFPIHLSSRPPSLITPPAQADIINRGFGGYTSKQAVEMVPEIIETVNMKNTPLVTVWFGANDAVTLDGNQ